MSLGTLEIVGTKLTRIPVLKELTSVTGEHKINIINK